MNRLSQKAYKPLYDRLPRGQSAIAQEYDAEATAEGMARDWEKLGPGVVRTGLAFLATAAWTAEGWVRFYEGEAAIAKNDRLRDQMLHKVEFWRDNAAVAIELHDKIAVRLGT